MFERMVTALENGNGVRPNRIVFHNLLSMFTHPPPKAEVDLDGAWAVLDMMRRAGILPDTHTYNHLIRALSEDGDRQGVEGVLQQMKADGLQPDSVTYRYLAIGAEHPLPSHEEGMQAVAQGYAQQGDIDLGAFNIAICC